MAESGQIQMLTITEAARQLEAKTTTSRELVENCLANIAQDQNARAAFQYVDAEGARQQADKSDHLRGLGHAPSPYAGIPISVKDLFDVAGQVTTAGSKALSGKAPASKDADAIAALRAAGLVIIGRTHMTEFAYSGLGINPHFPALHSHWDPDSKRVPGGSSSGAALSVATGSALGAIGSDTGGSCRIPAAFNQLTGYKPTAERISRKGMIPLSNSLDSVGSIAQTLECCTILDQIMAGTPPRQIHPIAASDARILVPTNVVCDDADPRVLATFKAALNKLEEEGVSINHVRVPALDRLPALAEGGGIVAAESYAWHHRLIETHAEQYDPLVLDRILRGKEIDSSQLKDLLNLRQIFINEIAETLQDFDCLAMPTVPIAPPAIQDCALEADYRRYNLLALRNPSLVNLMDGCALSIPLNRFESMPAGLMLAGKTGSDNRLLQVGHLIESCISIWRQ